MPQSSEDGQFEHQMLLGTALPITFNIFCNSTMPRITGSAIAVCLDSQIFYSPTVAAGLEPASRGLLVRKGKPSTVIFGAPSQPPPPPPPPQDAYDPQRRSAGKSQDDAILILGDSESDDDLNDGRSDASFRVASAGKSIDAAPDESDAPEPFSSSPETLHATWTQPVLAGCAAFGPGPASAADNTSRDTTVPETDAASLAEHGAIHHSHGMQHSSRPSEKPSGTTSNHDGSICLDNKEWDRRFPFSYQALQRRLQARRAAKSAHNPAEPDQSQPILDPLCRSQGPRRAASSHRGELQQTSDSCSLFPRYNYRGDSDQTSNPEHHYPVPDDRGEQSGVCPAVPPRAEESRAPTPILPDDESTSELEPADAEPRPQPQSPCSAASGR
ncbi:hypothetical protein C8A00DRAFT_35416 [Chaetomidium leptoderma]|uniref:Uncharacterized protein n=1 Tax=Chaetomidium leptoderma TaxID=669021 RepID=A0AAN6ZVM2_9PEZI|nr:hypothetical protein C8A00DRAFT_35416 [Chaetomidium leptoderma]